MHRAQPRIGRAICWLGGLAAAACATGCGGGESANAPVQDAAVQPLAIKANGPIGGASPTATPDRYALTPTTEQPLVRITTSLGPIVVRLDPQAARVTVQNFLNYAQSGHYAETVFHYVEQGQMILGGAFTADGSARPAGMSIRNEAHNGRKNRRGTVAMARDADIIDSATSQFFINLQDAPHLDHHGDSPEQYGYCVFGEVVEGLDVAEKISAIPTHKQVVDGVELSVPTSMVRIESVEVLR